MPWVIIGYIWIKLQNIAVWLLRIKDGMRGVILSWEYTLFVNVMPLVLVMYVVVDMVGMERYNEMKRETAVKKTVYKYNQLIDKVAASKKISRHDHDVAAQVKQTMKAEMLVALDSNNCEKAEGLYDVYKLASSDYAASNQMKKYIQECYAKKNAR